MPFGQSDAMADATLRFLSDTAFQDETRRKAYRYAKAMFWPNVGRQYLDFFSQLVSSDQTRLERLHRRIFATPPTAASRLSAAGDNCCTEACNARWAS